MIKETITVFSQMIAWERKKTKNRESCSFPVSSNRVPWKREMRACIEKMNVPSAQLIDWLFKGGPPLSFPREHVGVYLGQASSSHKDQPPIFQSQPPRPSSSRRNARRVDQLLLL